MKTLDRLLAAALLLGISCGLGACSHSRNVTMNSMSPADVPLPASARMILIVDRSADTDAAVGLLESVVTGELPDQDRAGLQVLISALRDQLARSSRFDTRVATEALPGNSLTRAFPKPLPWDEVDALLARYKADILLSIEIFDSDFIVTNGKKEAPKSGDGIESLPEYSAEGIANLAAGFRIYDPSSRDILDEELFNRTRTWEARGSTVQDALLALGDKLDAAEATSRSMAIDYAFRIAPMPIRINRTFYGRSKEVPQMEAGGRYADVGDWAGAIEVWEEGIKVADARDAGRLCYNIAIAYEVLGDWEAARDWAERAYVEYGNKDARDYTGALDRRVWREELAMKQME